MDYSFDIRGNLKPHEQITYSLEEFEDFFVNRFDSNSKRHEIYNNYQTYISDFRKLVGNKFTHWIDGSFVTKNENPRDIDFVTILDYKIVEGYNEVIKNQFLNRDVLKKYKLDAYLVIDYPVNHKYHIRTKSDLLYWDNWFTKSKMDKRRKRFPKGYACINFI